ELHRGEGSGVVTAGDRAVGGDGGGARLAGEHVVERVQLLLARIDLGEVLVDDVTRRPLPGSHGRGDVDRRRHGASPRMRGTRNWSSSAAGACPSTSSRSRPGRGSSGRNTFTSGSGCAVGGTSAVSRDETSAA